MKLEKYLKILNGMVLHNPELKALEGITSGDDEGNSYNADVQAGE